MGLISNMLKAARAPETQNAGLIGYILNEERTEPPQRQGGLLDYVLAADGLYLHAQREELEVHFPIAPAEIRGLIASEPVFGFKPPLVPWGMVSEIWREAYEFGADGLETLFHLIWSPVYPWNDGWELVTPEQTRSAARCRPLDDSPGSSHARALIEIHSHHSMPARFSSTDDADETGFRLYGVIGRIPEAPEIRLRVGVYGYHWEIPACWVLDLPEGLSDCNGNAEES